MIRPSRTVVTVVILTEIRNTDSRVAQYIYNELTSCGASNSTGPTTLAGHISLERFVPIQIIVFIELEFERAKISASDC
jgi:hypothetical protein